LKNKYEDIIKTQQFNIEELQNNYLNLTDMNIQLKTDLTISENKYRELEINPDSHSKDNKKQSANSKAEIDNQTLLTMLDSAGTLINTLLSDLEKYNSGSLNSTIQYTDLIESIKDIQTK